MSVRRQEDAVAEAEFERLLDIRQHSHDQQVEQPGGDEEVAVLKALECDLVEAAGEYPTW